MLKTIKKKDTITIFITEAEPLRLGITVEQATEKNKSLHILKLVIIVQKIYNLVQILIMNIKVH